MLEKTKDELGQMKLFGMLAALDTRLTEATSQSWGHVEFLSALASDEKLYRDDRRTKRLINTARFRVQASFESFDLTAKRNITKPQVQNLMELRFVKEPQNVLLLGPTGVGKTFLATAIGHHACRRGHTCRFLGMNLFIEQLKIARADGTYLRLRDRLVKTHLLILDDLGINPLPPQAIQDLYDLLEERYQSGATIITSQLPLPNWKEVIDDDVAYEAIMDRLTHGALKIEIKGESYRKKQAKTRQEKKA